MSGPVQLSRGPEARDRVLFAVAAAVTLVFFIDVCGWVFACGCKSLWAGAAAECNVRHSGPRHCPWCAVPLSGAAAWAGVTAVQALIMFRGWGVPRLGRFALALLAFPLVAGALGAAAGLLLGYW